MISTLRSISARLSGDILARNSAYLCVLIAVLLADLQQMFIVQLVGFGNVLRIPSTIAGLDAAQQQYRHSARVESIEDAKRTSSMLNPKLSHVAMSGLIDR